MHLRMMVVALLLAYGLRWLWPWFRGDRSQRWYSALILFALPPLLLISTAVAVVCMGVQGSMWGFSVGWIGYWIAIGFLVLSVGSLFTLMGQTWKTLCLVRSYPLVTIQQIQGRLLDSGMLFAGQVGLWRSQLLVSQGLLDRLEPAQLQAVLTHEQAHDYYRDPFWFFGLGWLRQSTLWLPQTEALWQELLVLRECRADAWAISRSIDPLVLAETLLLVVQDSAQAQIPIVGCVAFGGSSSQNSAMNGAIVRLEERIEALLEADFTDFHGAVPNPFAVWLGLVIPALPLLTIPFHLN